MWRSTHRYRQKNRKVRVAKPAGVPLESVQSKE